MPSMICPHSVWLVPTALALVSVGQSTAPVIAQTTYPFNANFHILITGKNITSNVAEILISGESTDAPYSLTEISGLGYTQTDLATGFFKSYTDPTTLGLQDLPLGSIIFYGDSNNKLFGFGSDIGSIDFKTLNVSSLGTLTITNGMGKFESATGTLVLSQIEPPTYEPGLSLKGQIEVNGSFQAVPEPETNNTIFVLGMMVAGMLLRQRK